MPITDKRRVMERWDDVVTVPVSQAEALDVALRAERERDFAPMVRGYTVGLSSGTSGNRGLFVASGAERQEWAGAAIARVLPDALPGLREHRVAFFLRANSNLYESVGSRRIQFEFFDLLDPVAENIRRLGALDPTIVIAPPSMLRILADAMLEARLRIKPCVLVSVAEVLDPLDEGIIRRAFGRTVGQVYQATEGFIGSSCAYGTVHLAEDVMVVEREELGDPEGRFHPILTDFRRRSQPILRYRLDDVLVPRRSACPCRSPFIGLDRIEGRADDVLWTRRGPIFPDFVRRAVMLSSASISDYRVCQISESQITLWLRAPGDAAAQSRAAAAIERLFERLCGLRVEVERAAEPERAAGKKLRRVERAFSPPGGA